MKLLTEPGAAIGTGRLTIERIFLSPGHNYFGHFGGPAGNHPIVEVEAVACAAGRGLHGDRFFDYRPDYKGQVTLFSAEIFEQLCRDLALPGASPAALRRNVIVRGADLNALRGREFELQGVRLLGGEECKPCVWMDQALGPGAEAWLRGRGGLRCRILSDGWLRRSNRIRLAQENTEGMENVSRHFAASDDFSVPSVPSCEKSLLPAACSWRGAVLAGGESRRMGTDKALLEFDGLPLWRRQQRVLAAAGMDDVVLVRRPGQSDLATGLPLCRDRFTGAGPIAGLHAALTWNLACPEPAEGLAALAVDMPGIDAGWFTWLRRHCRPGGGAVARHAGGFEPLAAIYPSAALPVIEERIRSAHYSLQGLVAALAAAGLMCVVSLPEADRRRVANWNSPADRTS
jgi:molybdopterin-guanine dinucleotide biosynthesis protein A/MOSC domain-containing protein YiiM